MYRLIGVRCNSDVLLVDFIFHRMTFYGAFTFSCVLTTISLSASCKRQAL